jgi:hypothetical protein
MSPLTYAFAFSAERVGRAIQESLVADSWAIHASTGETNKSAEKSPQEDET